MGAPCRTYEAGASLLLHTALSRWRQCQRTADSGQETIPHRTQERCTAKGKDTTILSHGPVAGSVRVAGDTDHERVEGLATHGTRELGIPEGEHTTVVRDEPVPMAIGGAGDPIHGSDHLVRSHGSVEGSVPVGEHAPVDSHQPVTASVRGRGDTREIVDGAPKRRPGPAPVLDGGSVAEPDRIAEGHDRAGLPVEDPPSVTRRGGRHSRGTATLVGHGHVGGITESVEVADRRAGCGIVVHDPVAAAVSRRAEPEASMCTVGSPTRGTPHHRRRRATVAGLQPIAGVVNRGGCNRRRQPGCEKRRSHEEAHDPREPESRATGPPYLWPQGPRIRSPAWKLSSSDGHV